MPATAPLRHLKECRQRKCNTGEIPHATLRKSICIFEEKVLAKNNYPVGYKALTSQKLEFDYPVGYKALTIICQPKSDSEKKLPPENSSPVTVLCKVYHSILLFPSNHPANYFTVTFSCAVLEVFPSLSTT